MKLYAYCKSCKKEIKIKSSASTRPELQMEKGDDFNVNCQNCGVIEKKHINDIVAEPNKTIILFGILIGVFVTIFLWIYFGAIGTVSIIIPVLFWQQQNNETKGFNSYLIRRKKN